MPSNRSLTRYGRALLTRWIGRVLNVLRVPGVVRANGCERRLDVPVEVRIDPLFTVIAVHNVRLFFRRLSGRLDGIAIDSGECLEVRQPGGEPRLSQASR